ncbi:MAG: cysteine--tRNA ligase [Nanoarchaeota archaeon]
MLNLYNTLSRKKESFKPIKKEVGMYSCGPTVYWYPHVGNMRTYIFSDILKRVLDYNGYKVKHVMNITDVGHLTSDADAGEDRMESAVLREHKSAEEIADFYTQVFLSDMKKLNILIPNFMPKATEHIKEQIALIKELEKKGFTYKTHDGIYFNSTKFKNYGKLAKINLKGLEAGKRIDIGEKKHKTDFALWKFSQNPGERQQEYQSPWGLGFPGWHLECSAMSMKYLGKSFDIHTGGIDHIPIHHTNEIAQSESATGKKFVKYWLHGAFLNFKGEKVSKSKGGLYTISELEKLGYNPMHFRYLCLLTHYRKPLNFTLSHLEAAKSAYERLKRKVQNIEGGKAKKDYEKQFAKALNNDLNMPEAIQILWKALEDTQYNSKAKKQFLEKADSVLGLELLITQDDQIPENVQSLLVSRQEAREKKDFKLADKIREQIKSLGFIVEDTPEGQKVSKS